MDKSVNNVRLPTKSRKKLFIAFRDAHVKSGRTLNESHQKKFLQIFVITLCQRRWSGLLNIFKLPSPKNINVNHDECIAIKI